MSCPTCGTAGTCPSCTKGSWGSAFDSWGSSSGEWGDAGGNSSGEWAKAGRGVATAEPPASSWLAPQQPQPASDGWSAPATPPVQRPKPVFVPDEADGWSAPSAAAPTLAHPQEPKEEEQGWWTPEPPGPSSKSLLEESYEDDLPLQPVAAQWAEEEDEEAWLDGDRDEEESAPALQVAPAGNTLTWIAIVATGVMLVGGLMFLQKPNSATVAPAAMSKIDQRMEALQNGRRLVIAGRDNMQGDKAKGGSGDAEAASYQLVAGIKALKEGKASPREVGAAQSLLANCYWTSRNWESAYKTWNGMASVPEYKAEANAGKGKAKAKLLTKADSHLENSSGSLRARQYDQSIAQAKEALRLMEAYGGTASKKGITHGNIAFAEKNLGHRSAALSHFNQAFALSGNSLYADQVYALSPSGPVETEPVAAAPPPGSVSATIGGEPQYPNGVPGQYSPTTPSQPSQPAETQTAPSNPTNQNKPFIFKPPAPTPPKPRPDDSFDMTDRSQK